MKKSDAVYSSYEEEIKKKITSIRWKTLHIDPLLFFLLLILLTLGLFILYSASDQSMLTVKKQLMNIGLGFCVLLLFAQIPPYQYQKWTPWVYGLGIFLLILVLLIGKSGQGAQRWLSLGGFRFQPSELIKLATPMMLAWYFHDKVLPPKIKFVAISLILIGMPALLTAKQPDLGTGIIIAVSGLLVIFLANISSKLIALAAFAFSVTTPILWHFLHTYQKQRVLTFLNPERDPLGAGYHVIQSKIAIGSGGFLGKGWLLGTQSHLEFLPAHTTDFIFSVAAEEFGYVGVLILMTVFLVILGRCLYISLQAQTTYTRLLAGSLSLTFFLSMFINIGMVVGILPVVGVPLPLVSYGGTSIVSLMGGFGILMSIATHKKLLTS